MLYLNQVTQGNSVELMKQIDDNTIDLTITSPPYDLLRSYKGKVDKEIIFDSHFSFPFVEMATELYRITKDGGIVVWVVGDSIVDGGETGNSFRQALKFQEIGFKLYDTMIYHKNGAPFPESGRYSQVFEYMFIFLKGKKTNNKWNLVKISKTSKIIYKVEKNELSEFLNLEDYTNFRIFKNNFRILVISKIRV